MLTFNNLEEMEPYYIKETNTYVFEEAITINFPLFVGANINAHDINAWDITAWDITARDINAMDINTMDINAKNIEYWAVCIAYRSFKCKSVKGRRENSIHKCLDQEIEFVKIRKEEKI